MEMGLRLKVVRGGTRSELSLRELLSRPTVVSVYLRNNTGTCDRQIASLVAAAAQFEALGFNVVALSRDTCTSHLKYAEKAGVGFTLVSDPENSFSKAAGAMVEKAMYGRKYMGPARAAYVLDTNGRVLAVITKVDAANHAAQVREVIGKI